MKKMMKKMAAFLCICLMLVGTLSACSNSTANKDDKNQNANSATKAPNNATDNSAADDANLSGTITMAGSTSMEKIANAAAEAFMGKYPKVTVTAEFIGSGAGIEALLKKTVDIGNSSRSLTDSEKGSGAVENIVAIDGIAVIFDKGNKVTNLSKDQLTKIYTGEITNWKDVGGADQPIVVIGRESGSGTRDAFEELLQIADKCKYANEINSTGGVMAKVASTPGSIGYVSLDVLDDTVSVANIDNVAPTEENIKADKYLLNRPFVMATNGDISKQSKQVQAFFNYLKSEEGKQLIKSAGLITVD